MAQAISLLHQLHPSRTYSIIKFRCVRVYKIPNSANKDEINSVELVIHDSEGQKIHATVPKNLVNTWGQKFKEGELYCMHKFFVRNNQMRYKTANHIYKIIMFQKTEIIEISENDFPKHMFNFKSFQEISAIENTQDQPLFDVIGVIVGHGYIKDKNNAKLLELVLEDEEHNKLYYTLWEDYVDDLLSQMNLKNKKLPIVLIQFVRPTLYQGEIRIQSAYNATKVSLNKDLQEIHDFRERISGDESFIRADVGNALPKKEVDEFKDGSISVKSIEELFYYEDGSFWIFARIESVDCYLEWFYNACKRCTRKVAKICSRFYCGTCNKYDGTAAKRYMLRLNVVDVTNNVELLVWDKECITLIGKKASEISLDEHEVKYPNIIPKEINDKLIGQSVLFKIQLRKGIENQHEHPYNVIKVCNIPHILKDFSTKELQSQETNSISDIAFLEECNSLSQLTQLPTIDEDDKNSQYDFTTPNDGQTSKSSEDEYFIAGGVKRKLDDEFDACESLKKFKAVKVEKD